MLLTVMAGFGLTLAMFFLVANSAQDRLANHFERETSSLAMAAQLRIESYMDVLYSLRDYYDAEGHVSRQAFGTFVRGPLARHSGIHALEWVPVVPGTDRERFEAAARREGLSGFRLTERDAQGGLRPAAERDVYYPVFYVEPFAGNERALGHAPVLPPRDEAIARAIETALPAATGRFKAIQVNSANDGVAIFLPIYAQGLRSAAKDARHKRLRGFIEGVFLPRDMLKAYLDEAERLGIAVSLTDDSAPPEQRELLTSSLETAHPGAVGSPGLSRDVPFDMAGRNWRLSFHLTHPHLLEGFLGQEWWVLLGGLIATGLMGGYLSSVLNQRSRVEQMVVERTEALHQEKELAQKYLNVAAVMIVMVQPDGKVALINRQGSEILGYPQEEIIGQDWFETFVPVRDRALARSRTAGILCDTSLTHFYEGPVLTRSGEERLIAWYSTGLRNEAGQAIATLSSGADVTDYKRAIEEVAVRRAELAQAKENDRLKNNFTSAVSHDLRTPLTSIMGYAEFLEDGIGGSLTPQQQGYVSQIRRGAKRLEHLVDDLLDFARLDAGTFQLRREPADLGHQIFEVAESLGPQFEEAHLELVIQAAPGDLDAPMDAARIERVLFNMLHNALKFTPAGGTIRVRAWAQDGDLRCEVEDTGIGIAAEQISRLFQPFSQLQSGSEKGGTGLGLSICKAIIDAHGGRIGVRSTPGDGSVFWFSLPVA